MESRTRDELTVVATGEDACYNTRLKAMRHGLRAVSALAAPLRFTSEADHCRDAITKWLDAVTSWAGAHRATAVQGRRSPGPPA